MHWSVALIAAPIILIIFAHCACAKRFKSFYPNGMDDNFEKQNQEEEGQIWVLLVAGSNGWYNYRHQADVCHAYQVIRRHGVSKANIITMMYDDIASDHSNPYPGKLFNVPGGKDVYAGVSIDYAALDVTPHNFIAILGGNKTAVKGGTGRVINSGPNDRIFVYFSDHGAVGLLSFPDGVLTVSDLNDALKRMYKMKKYDQLVFYVEACESGSMFAHILPKNINVYAVTASNTHESSWGCFCENKLKLPCMGDCFSINWIVDSETEDLRSETLSDQFRIVKQETNLSHVMHYGDLKIGHEIVAKFMGAKSKQAIGLSRFEEIEQQVSIAWPSREVYLRMLEHQLSSTQDESERQLMRNKIEKVEMKREYLLSFFKSLVWSLVPEAYLRHDILNRVPHRIRNVDCYDKLIKSFHSLCFHFGRNPYALKYAYVLANLCAEDYDTQFLQEHLFRKCMEIEIQGIH